MTTEAMISALDSPLRLKLLKQLAIGDLRVQELSSAAGAPMNLVSYHLKRLREAGLVRERRSIADGRDQYYSLDLQSLKDQYLGMGSYLHPALSLDRSCLPAVQEPIRAELKVLFLCTHNSARSQIAEAILRRRAGESMKVASAGTHPAEVHPLAIELLKAQGYPASGLRSKDLAPFIDEQFDYVITVCDRAREECPVFSGARNSLHWSIPDPVEAAGSLRQRRSAFQAVAQELDVRIEALLIVMQTNEEAAK